MTVLTGVDARLRASMLYLCTDARQQQGDLSDFIAEVVSGGVDIVQVRQKGMSLEDELATLEQVRSVAQRWQALVAVNDNPILAGVFGADLLHLGQTDSAPAAARRRLHPWARIGRSTHSVQQAEVALADPEVDYFCVGPVWATPTKPDYQPVGLELVRHAAEIAPPTSPDSKPWFAIGGIDLETVEEVVEAGARRVVVVRALTESTDPHGSARALKNRLRRAWRADGDAAGTDFVLGPAPSAPLFRPPTPIAAGETGPESARTTDEDAEHDLEASRPERREPGYDSSDD